MKTKELFKLTLLVLMALLGTLTASAAITYDFSAPNAAGQIIYYNILDEDAQTVELAYAYDTYGYGHNVYNGYGDMVIPSTVEYNGKTYTVTHVRRLSFYRADITSVSLPNTIDSIGNGAFLGCMNLSSFTVPENVKILGGGMLSGETGVGSGRSNVNKLYYNAKYADGRRYNANLGPFYLGGCEVIIGEEVEHLPNNFLRECLIRSISIPSNVTSIGEYAFYNCRHLGPNVIIPQNVTSIGISAFSGCDSLTTVIATMTTPPSIEDNVFPNRRSQTLYVPSGCLPNYVTADYWKEFKKIEEPTRIYFEDSNVEAICVQNWDTNGDGYLDQIEAYLVTDLGTTFQGNSQITKFNELQYFTGLKSVSANAFQGCTGLTEMTLPTSLKTIGNCAFMGCSHLVSVSNLNDISTIGESAFANCTNLTDLTVNAATIKSNAFQGCTGLTSATVSATTVESNAFNGCTGLITATVTATTVESNAFHGCIRLAELTVRATTVAGDAFQGCTNLATVSFNANSVESNTFQGCTHLTSVTLGNKVADIKEGAFRNCTALTSINIPGTVVTISGGFEGCTSLSNVTLNSGTKYIVNSVFQGCSSLRSITLPNGLLYIGESVFEGTGLSEINIPSSVTSIQSRAFYGCDNMTKVTVNWTTPLVVPADAFPNRANQWLIVPQGTKESYQAADVWKDFKWIFQDGEVIYGINVGGVVVSDQNVADITGASITGGSVSFDPATHVLTLTDATITSSTAPGIQVTTDYVFNDLTIRLVGDNTINTNNYSPVALRCQTTITGPGSLTVKLNGYNGYIDMMGEHPLIIEGGCTIYGSSISGSNSATLKVRGADTEINLSSFIYGFGSVTLEDGLDYVVPEGGSYDANIGYTVDSNGNRWTNGVIIKVLPYVVYDSGNTTLTFYCDSKRSTHNGATETSYLLNEGANDPGWYTDNSCGNVSTVVFDPSFADARPTSTCHWFDGMYRMTRLIGLMFLNTSEVTNMSYMFGSYQRPTLDLSHFDTGKVTDMSRMFASATLTSLDLTSFDTGNVTDMSYMFSDCSALESVDLSSFMPINVTNMDGMFYECTELAEIDLGDFNTSSVTSMVEMFFDCCNLTTLDLSSFETHNVTSMMSMFIDCNKLASVDLSNFNTANVTNMNSMFGNCFALTSLDLSSFDTHSVTDMSSMFDSCRGLETVYVGDEWSTEGVTTSTNMFGGCVSIVGGRGTTYDANHIDKAYAHVDGGTSNPGYFTAKTAFLRGDVNGDGSVNIADVTSLIDYLLSSDASGVNLSAADCNQDSSINISDVTTLIDYLLANHW